MCISCDSTDHTSTKCTRVPDVASQREILKCKKAGFTWATLGHQVSSCRTYGCHRCGQKHHTTICTLLQQSYTGAMGSSFLQKGMSGTHLAVCAIHSTLYTYVNGEKVGIMIDTGASSSYICSDMIALLGLKHWKLNALALKKDVVTFLPKLCIDQIKKNKPRMRQLVFCEEGITSHLVCPHYAWCNRLSED